DRDHRGDAVHAERLVEAAAREGGRLHQEGGVLADERDVVAELAVVAHGAAEERGLEAELHQDQHDRARDPRESYDVAELAVLQLQPAERDRHAGRASPVRARWPPRPGGW